MSVSHPKESLKYHCLQSSCVCRSLGYVAPRDGEHNPELYASHGGSADITDTDTVQLKGRVACEVNTADELITTEIVFENVLQGLEPAEIAGQ